MQISQNISHLMKNSAIEVTFLVKTQNMWRNSLYLGEIKTINQAFYYLKQVITPHFTTQDAYNEQKLHPKKLQKNEKQTLHQQQGTKKKGEVPTMLNKKTNKTYLTYYIHTTYNNTTR